MNKSANHYLLIVSIAALYFITAFFGLMLSYPGTIATPIWLPAGIALSAVLLRGNRVWPGIALGAFLANFQQLTALGLSLPASSAASLGIAAGNTLEALVGASLVHRFAGTKNPFQRTSDVLVFIMLGALLSSMVSASIGAAAFCGTISAWSTFPSVWLTWWLGDAAGAILLVPLIMTIHRIDASAWTPRSFAGDALLWAVIGVVCYSIFSRHAPLNFMLFPVLVLAAFRLGQFGSAMAVGIISVVSTYATVNGIGPFAAATMNEALVQQQGFICSIAMASMLLAASVAEQKQSALKMHASERKYRELVTNANSIILRWNSEGNITFLNEFGLKFFGYSETEIMGRSVIGTIVAETESTGRDLRPLMAEILADPRKFERNVNENVRRSGEPVWIDWTNKVVLDEQGQIREILSIGSDITDQRKAEEEIRRLHEDLQRHANTLEQRVNERTAELAAMNDEQRAIFESAGTGIVLLRNRTIVRCNRKLEEISGYAPGELVGKSTRIWYPDDASYIAGGEKVYAYLARGETYRQEQQMARKDGVLFWVRMSLCALDKQDPVKGTVGIIEDITDEREAAEKLRRAMEAAQAADRIKSAFLATMSHELRTPLNSIIGFTGILLQGLAGPLNPEQHKQMAMVQNSSRHLLALINDVLDISKIEAGELVLSPSTFDLGQSIEKVVRMVAPLAGKKGIEVRRDFAVETGFVTTDQRRLEQVMLNLLNNAIKFTGKGYVRVACRREDNQYILAFSDTGLGIRQEDIPHLFQPFRQIDSGITRKHEGTGLGLSICRKIIDLMGGSISVESRLGVGSTFTVRIPGIPGGQS